MSAVSETIVREYFELHEFLVRQRRKYIAQTRREEDDIDFFVLNPLFILSGFSFPISSMPDVLQWFTYVNPLRYFLVVIRGTFL